MVIYRHPRASRGIYLLAAFLVLTACATETKLPSEVELQSAQQFEARRLDESELKDFMKAGGAPVPTWPLRTWNLNQLNMAALYYSPDLDVARAQWHTIKAAEITAGQIPNPSVGFSPTWDETQLYHLFLPFNLNIPIETADKRQLRIQNAQDQSKSAEYKIVSMAWTVRTRLINSLIDCYAADRSVALYRKQAKDQKPIVDLFNQRAASGQSLNLNAGQILVAYQQTLLAEKDAERQQAEARASLAAALGLPLDAITSLNIDWKTIASVEKKDSSVPDGLRETTLNHNAELMAALADYIAAHSALQLELAKRIPDINIGPGYDWSRNGNIYTLGLSITLPIFNDNEGPIAEAKAKREEAAERFNALQARIIGDIEVAQAGYKVSFAKLKRAAELLGAEQAKFNRLSTQLGGGDAAKLPLLLARSEIETADIAELEARAQWLKAKAALEYVLEQPLFDGEVNDRLTSINPRETP